MWKINLIIGTVSAAGPGNLQENILVELLWDHFMIMQEVGELLENSALEAESTEFGKTTVVGLVSRGSSWYS